MAVRYLATRHRLQHNGPEANSLALRMPELDVGSNDYSPMAATARIANYGRPSQPTGPPAVRVGSDAFASARPTERPRQAKCQADAARSAASAGTMRAWTCPDPFSVTLCCQGW